MYDLLSVARHMGIQTPSRSWCRAAREFDVKGLSFRLKGQPLASAMAELVGKDVFTFAGKWHNQ